MTSDCLTARQGTTIVCYCQDISGNENKIFTFYMESKKKWSRFEILILNINLYLKTWKLVHCSEIGNGFTWRNCTISV